MNGNQLDFIRVNYGDIDTFSYTICELRNFAIFVFNNIQFILIGFVFMPFDYANNKIIKYIMEFMVKNEISIPFALLLSNVSLENR